MTQQVFAQTLGISSASLSSIFNDRTKPTLKHVEAIRNRFPNINLDWLMFGDGPMFLQDKDSQDQSEAPTTAQEPTLDFGGDHPASSPLSPVSPNSQGVYHTPDIAVRNEVKYIDKPQRKITEIRVFYDDQTWETFVPRK